MPDKPLPKYFFVKLIGGAVCVVVFSLIFDCLMEHYMMPYPRPCLLEYVMYDQSRVQIYPLHSNNSVMVDCRVAGKCRYVYDAFALQQAILAPRLYPTGTYTWPIDSEWIGSVADIRNPVPDELENN